MLDPSLLRLMARTWARALEAGLLALLGVLLGFWLDDFFNTRPVLLAIFSIGALTGGMVHLAVSLRETDDPNTP